MQVPYTSQVPNMSAVVPGRCEAKCLTPATYIPNMRVQERGTGGVLTMEAL